MRCWLPLILTTLASPGNGAESPYTVADLVAGYYQNFAQFRTLRVQMRYTEQYKAYWLKHWECEADRLEKLAQDSETPVADRARLLSQADGYRKMARHPDMARPHHTLQDFWMQGRCFQQRVPLAAAGWNTPPADGGFVAAPGAENWTFADEPPTAANLTRLYREVQIVSYAPETGYRGWAGRHRPTGQAVGWRSSQSKGGIAVFPPLGQPPPEWQVSLMHVMDQFFALPQKEMRLGGVGELEGRRVYLIEHVAEAPYQTWLQPHEIAKYAGKVQRFNVVRVWVDVERGCLPVRMEWDSYLARNGEPLEAERAISGQRPLWRVLEEVRISAVEGGGFYPMTGVLRTYADDLSSGREPLTVSDILEGRAKSWPPTVLTKEERWEVLKLEANIPVPEGFFALPFPKNTVYYDAAQGAGLVTGSAQEYLDGVVGPEGQALRPETDAPAPAAHRWWLPACVGAVVLGLLAWLVRLRLKGRPARQAAAEAA
jgi:hypothetical protein